MIEPTRLSDVLQIFRTTYLFSVLSSDDRKSESQNCLSNILYIIMLLTFAILDFFALEYEIDPDWSIIFKFSAMYWKFYVIIICLVMIEYRLISRLKLIRVLQAIQDLEFHLLNSDCFLKYGKSRITMGVKLVWVISLLLLSQDVHLIVVTDLQEYPIPTRILYFIGCCIFFYFFTWHILGTFFLSVVLEITACQAATMYSNDRWMRHKFARMGLKWFTTTKKLFSVFGYLICANAIACFSTFILGLYQVSQEQFSCTVVDFISISSATVLNVLWLFTAGGNVQYQVRITSILRP